MVRTLRALGVPLHRLIVLMVAGACRAGDACRCARHRTRLSHRGESCCRTWPRRYGASMAPMSLARCRSARHGGFREWPWRSAAHCSPLRARCGGWRGCRSLRAPAGAPGRWPRDGRESCRPQPRSCCSRRQACWPSSGSGWPQGSRCSPACCSARALALPSLPGGDPAPWRGTGRPRHGAMVLGRHPPATAGPRTGADGAAACHGRECRRFHHGLELSPDLRRLPRPAPLGRTLRRWRIGR